MLAEQQVNYAQTSVERHNSESLLGRIERIQTIREMALQAGHSAQETCDRILGHQSSPASDDPEMEPPRAPHVLSVLDENLDMLEQAVRAIMPPVDRLSRL